MNYATGLLRNSKKVNRLGVNSRQSGGTMSFHEQIKVSTDAAHAQAENAQFIASLMGGALDKLAYRDYLTAFLPIYIRMEELLKERQESQLISYFSHRALDRAEEISNDIAALDAKLNRSLNENSLKSVNDYLERLNPDITDARLLAHHYIRYLGDLSGGQAISKLVARHYAIEAGALTFYDFAQIGDTVFYKKRYRDLLNLVPFTEQDKIEFLDEVSILYKLTTKIFLELGEIHAPTKA